MDPDAIDRVVRKYAAELGLDRGYSAHSMRATFIATALEKGKTPVLEGDEWRKPFASIPTATLRDLRDRALIATLTDSFTRTTAALKMRVEDLRPRGPGWTV